MLQFDQLDEGVRFRLMRVAAGLTLFQVATRTGVAAQRLSEYERGVGALPPEAVGRVRAVLEAEAEHAIA